MKNKLVSFCTFIVIFMLVLSPAAYAEKAVEAVSGVVGGVVGVVLGAVGGVIGCVVGALDADSSCEEGAADGYQTGAAIGAGLSGVLTCVFTLFDEGCWDEGVELAAQIYTFGQGEEPSLPDGPVINLGEFPAPLIFDDVYSEFLGYIDNHYHNYSFLKSNDPSTEADLNISLCTGVLGAWLPDTTGALNADEYAQLNFENFCCGDDWSYDNGIIVTGVGPIDNHLVCVYDYDVGSWKWIAANQQKFAIKEITQPTLEDLSSYKDNFKEPIYSYDLVSSDLHWYACKNETTIGNIEFLSDEDFPTKESFSKFYCYKEGDKFRYGICSATEIIYQYNNNEYKASALRGIGSVSTMILEPDAPVEFSGVRRFALDPRFAASDDEKTDANIQDWTSYSSMDFFINFTDVSIPLYVVIFSPGADRDKLFDEPVLDYAVDTPVNNKWVHVSIPVGDWRYVKVIQFYEKTPASYPLPDYTISLDKIFLLSENENNTAYCSDRNYEPANGIFHTWISDLDNNNAACDANIPYDSVGDQCCGDDIGEYFNSSGKGCWNSETVNDDSTIMNVEYIITKTSEEKYEQTYPDIDVSFNVNTVGPFFVDYSNAISVGSDKLGEGFACPAGWAVCGAKNKANANNQLSMISCCPVFGARTTSGGTRELSDSEENKDVYCGTDQVVLAAQNRASDDFLKAFFCGNIERASVGTRRIVDNSADGGWKWCDENELVCGLKVYAGLDIDEFYCCEINPLEDSEFLIDEQFYAYKSIKYTSTINTEKVQTLNIPSELKGLTNASFFVISDLSSSNSAPFDVFFSDTGERTTKNPDAAIVVRTEHVVREIADPGSTITITNNHLCDSSSCIYPLNGKLPITVENVHPDEYNLYIVLRNGTKMLVNSTEETDEEGSYLLVEDLKQSVLFNDGKFYGCHTPAYIDYINQNYIDVTEVDYCNVQGTHYCSYYGGWSDNPLGAPTALSNTSKQFPLSIPLPEGALEYGCCPSNYCWNGTFCIEDLSSRPTEFLELDSKIFRCVAGDWVEADAKYTWDNAEKGFCPSETQCLVDIYGNVSFNNDESAYFGPSWNQNPQCIETGQFIEDHYCHNGNWTSRTKLIATQLLNISGATSSFTLYCDKHNKILPGIGDTTYRDILIEGKDFTFAISCFNNQSEWNTNHGYNKPCSNNFCSLVYTTSGGDPNIAIAASVNKPLDFSLNIPPIRFFMEEVFGIYDSNYCDHLFGETGISFIECNPFDNIEFWYSNGLNSVIHSYMQSLDGMQLPSTWDKITVFFRNVFGLIFGWEPVDRFGAVINVSFIEQTADFNQICISKQGIKEAYLVMEAPESGRLFLTARYKNLGTDICNIVNTLGLTEIDLDCTQTNSDYTVYAEADELSYLSRQDIETLWDRLVDTCVKLS